MRKMGIDKYIQALGDGHTYALIYYKSFDLQVVALSHDSLNRPNIVESVRKDHERMEAIKRKYHMGGLEEKFFKLGKIWGDFWLGEPPI